MPTQHVRSEVPSTKREKQQVEARYEQGNGIYYCSVEAILQSLDIEPATAVLYLVDGKEAEFIYNDGHPDYERLKFYSSKEIVVSVDPKGRTPRGSRQKANHSKTKPRPQSQYKNLAPVDNEDGNHNVPKDGKSRKYSMRHLTDKITKPQPVQVIFSDKNVEFKAHYSPPGGYHCHVSDIFETFKLDSTGSTIYKYTIDGTEAEFKKDKHNRIDFTKKIKYFPGQVIEIRVAPSEISSAVSDLTMIHEERNPNRRRESNGADSQSTANEGHDHNPQSEPHVDISPQASGTQERPSTSPKCPCEKRTLDVVNLSLTGAAMARKAFEPLAKLTSVSSLNVTLAWNFKKSDLSAVVKNLNEVAVEHLTLDLNDKKSWKRPEFMFPFGNKYQPLQDLYKNPHLQTFHLVGASRFGIRTSPRPDLSSTSLKCLHLRIRLDGKRDQAAAKNIIKNCPNLVDLRLGGIYKSEMHPTLKSTIEQLKHLEVLHFYGMQKNEFGGPILNLLGKVSLSGNKIKELVLVNSHMDAVETQTLITNCERTLTTIVLDHATFQPPNLKFLNTIPSNKPLLQNLTCLHLHVYENAENLQLLSHVLGQLSLTHLGLTQDDPKAVQDLLGKSLLQNVKLGSLHSLFLSGFSGPSLDPLWEAVGTITDGDSYQAVGNASLKYLSLEYPSRCPDLSSQLRRIQLESLWIVADVKELGCELAQLATSLDYSSLKKVAIFRSGDQQGPSLKSYFGQLEGHLRSEARAASNMTIRVGDFKKGSNGLSGLEMLSYVVDSRMITPGPKESTCKKHNPRYHRYRWGMTGWSDGSGPSGGAQLV